MLTLGLLLTWWGTMERGLEEREVEGNGRGAKKWTPCSFRQYFALISRYSFFDCGLMAILHDELHWLDVPERIEYKLGVMMYRCLHGQAPRYLADHLIPASDAAPRRGRLRSANRNCLIVPCCRLSTYGCRACPTVWNSLPDELRNSDSFDSFKRFMKTILFSRY